MTEPLEDCAKPLLQQLVEMSNTLLTTLTGTMQTSADLTWKVEARSRMRLPERCSLDEGVQNGAITFLRS